MDHQTMLSLEYATANTYTVSITGEFPFLKFNNSGDKDKIKTIEQWGDFPWHSMSQSFRGCSNLTYNATTAPNLSAGPSLSWMFGYATLFNGDISNWDVSEVSYFGAMFRGASSFNQDIGNWNTINAIDMSYVFAASAFNKNIGGWDMRKVVNTSYMFAWTDFNQDISSWEFENLTRTDYMFYQNDQFNQDISGLHV